MSFLFPAIAPLTVAASRAASNTSIFFGLVVVVVLNTEYFPHSLGKRFRLYLAFPKERILGDGLHCIVHRIELCDELLLCVELITESKLHSKVTILLGVHLTRDEVT